MTQVGAKNFSPVQRWLGRQGGRSAQGVGANRRFALTGAGYVAGEGEWPGHGLAWNGECKARSVQARVLCLAMCWKVMECGRIVRTLPEEKTALVGKGVLLQWAVAPTDELQCQVPAP